MSECESQACSESALEVQHDFIELYSELDCPQLGNAMLQQISQSVWLQHQYVWKHVVIVHMVIQSGKPNVFGV